MWAVIIVFVNFIGPILYLLIGRVEGLPDDEVTRPGRDAGLGQPSRSADRGAAGLRARWLGSAACIHRSGPGRIPSPRSRAAPSASRPPSRWMLSGRRLCPPTPPNRPRTARPRSRIEGLTRRYPGVLALDALTLDVPEGSVFGLLGPNGAGKTTTLRLLAGLGRPNASTCGGGRRSRLSR